MITADAGLRFWLRYVEALGGLTEEKADRTLVVLAERSRELLKLSEELVVTGDPDAAREDEALFLAAGHPVLGQAADDVLAVGDVGHARIPSPSTSPPSVSTLVAKAREQFSVDHGRIDSAAAPVGRSRVVLQVGALVSYAVSAEDHYQECAECFVDLSSHRELPESASAKLASLPHESGEAVSDTGPLMAAITEAHRVLSARAKRRQIGLSSESAKAFEADLQRAESYYHDMLASIARRRENAPADRREMLDARAKSVRQERERRLAEIREKFEPTYEIKPYRLHIYELPVWRLPVDVRRGDRRYPLTLDWMVPLARFADIRCPACAAAAPLVAGKGKLGCAGCLVKRPVHLVTDPSADGDRLAYAAS